MLPIPICPDKFLKKSRPPINIKNIKITTVCINIFCLLGKILDIRDKINNREVFYDHFADKSSANKWKSNHKLKTVNLNNLPKYLLDNKKKYKDWFDLRD